MENTITPHNYRKMVSELASLTITNKKLKIKLSHERKKNVLLKHALDSQMMS